ncbi:putative ww domain protein [Phaeomoniella chlamydospora]|uniref:Putative ww domain protein n=1 Tax=Phaeomoniella chlamydospora TaxID=158046 RepID=A0A0G2F430_PHACM|nr:putative ww domain protein [Phaeomoniella chlamydospora]
MYAASGRSGASPTPYPDDRTQYPRPQHPGAQPPYPDDRYPTPESLRATSPNYGYQPRTGSAASGTQHHTEYPQALRAGDGKGRSALAERRGGGPKPLPDSPGPDIPDKDGLFQKIPQHGPALNPTSTANNYANYNFPPPGGSEPNPAGKLELNDSSSRIDRNPSTSTTKAQRGSPPPPETPVIPPGHRPTSEIEARFAASGIAGTGTLTGLQAQSAAAQQRAQQYANQQQQAAQQSAPARRPWTPTEQPGGTHSPPTVYQGPNELSSHVPVEAAPVNTAAKRQSSGGHSTSSGGSRIPVNALESDLQKMNVNDEPHEPPPAYASVATTAPNPHYTAEKHRLNTGGPAAGAGVNVPGMTAAGGGATATAAVTPQPNPQDHPAFANDHNRVPSTEPAQPAANGSVYPQQAAYQAPQQNVAPASPPPLPEGWIAHLDPNSGQYYYIHLPTQSTQWEFPKGPTPLNLPEAPISPVGANHPLSPNLSTFGGKPIPSPGMPMSPSYDTASVMSLGTAMAGPTAFTGPPPSSGVDLYKVAPTNGVYFGPYLRYTNMDLENGIWLGSILLVTDAPQPPTIHIHQSVDLSPNPRQLQPMNIAKHQRWTFFKYEIDLRMEESGPAKWTYAITSHLGCTRYEFLVAGRHETGWRFISTSGNDFSLNVSANERQRIGGVGHMWKDIMNKHAECGGFHVQLGLGSQISADRLWKEIPSLKQWLAMSGKEIRKNATWTAAHEEDVSHAYFHYYTSHFDQPYLREAFAQIPHVLTIDDHDIFDGFGSYPDYMQFSNMFKNIGRIGIEMYLLFQHHTTLELLRNVSTDVDLFTITGTGWHFVKFLGPCVAIAGPDTRSERTPHQVMAGPTYQGFFPKIAMLPASVQHCILMVSVPLIYPRLEAAEQIAHTVATGKKAVTGAYNMLGKVTSSVAGVVGAKGAVGSGFDSVKRAVGKSGLMGGILSPFGDIDVLDELRDQWTHDSKDLERTYLIRTLQRIAQERSIRVSFMSGAVGVAGSGLVHDPSHPSDHKTMYQLIVPSVVNTPPPTFALRLLNTSKPLYLPANGQRSTPSVPTDTKEDMMEIFQVNPDGTPLGRAGETTRKLMARRGYVAVVAYDPEVVNGTFGTTDMHGQGQGKGRLSLAADFMVQTDNGAAAHGGYGGVAKYGPVVIPFLEYGR